MGDADEDALLSRLSGTAAGEPHGELDRIVRAFEDAGYLADGPRAPAMARRSP
ncbi:hypothetical protein STENM223S_04055 [Streptomyces tendae]